MEDGSKGFAMKFDEASHTLRVGMLFEYMNFNEDWHAGGFDLTKAYRRFIDFPELGRGCKMSGLAGRLSGQATGGHNYINMEFKGEGCRAAADGFRIEGMSLAFYGVPSLDQRPGAAVVRVVVRDSP